MDHKAQYILTASLLGLGAYLHSQAVVMSAVVLWGLAVADHVLNQKNKDAEIIDLILRMELIEKRNKELSMDIMNVQERAKTILGEVY